MTERRASQIRGTVSRMLIYFLHVSRTESANSNFSNEPTVIVEINPYLNLEEGYCTETVDMMKT